MIRKEIKEFISDNVKISYAKIYDKTKSQKSIILVHGNGESNKIFKKISEKLSIEYAVYCPDSRSHGKSSKVKRLHYRDIAEDIANLIKHENLEKPAFFGFSDGGIVGLMLAAKYPDLLEKLLVAGINLTPLGIKPFMRRITKIGYFFSKSDKLRLMLEEPDITSQDLKAIAIPTTVFYAENDVVELDDSQAVIDNAINAKLVKIPNENHASYVLNANKLYKLFLEHLLQIQ